MRVYQDTSHFMSPPPTHDGAHGRARTYMPPAMKKKGTFSKLFGKKDEVKKAFKQASTHASIASPAVGELLSHRGLNSPFP